MTEIAVRLTALTVIMAFFAVLFSILVANHARAPHSLRTGLTGERTFSILEKIPPAGMTVTARSA